MPSRRQHVTNASNRISLASGATLQLEYPAAGRIDVAMNLVRETRGAKER